MVEDIVKIIHTTPVIQTDGMTVREYNLLVRSCIAHAVRMYMLEEAKDSVDAIDGLGNLIRTLSEESGRLQGSVEEIKKDIASVIKNKSLEEFKWSLMYAAEKWGTPTERRSIKKVIEKINDGK